MNQQQRKEWNNFVEFCIKAQNMGLHNQDDSAVIQADLYIKELEKRLNIKEPAALFKEKNESTQ